MQQILFSFEQEENVPALRRRTTDFRPSPSVREARAASDCLGLVGWVVLEVAHYDRP
jgi:hypothetical protein